MTTKGFHCCFPFGDVIDIISICEICSIWWWHMQVMARISVSIGIESFFRECHNFFFNISNENVIIGCAVCTVHSALNYKQLLASIVHHLRWKKWSALNVIYGWFSMDCICCLYHWRLKMYFRRHKYMHKKRQCWLHAWYSMLETQLRSFTTEYIWFKLIPITQSHIA